MKMARRLPLAALLLLGCIMALLILPEITTQAAREGLRLCAQVLIPSLFPFFVCARLIVTLRAARPLEQLLAPVMQKLFGTSRQSSAALVLGLIGGYPTGAQTAKNLYDARQISAAEARQLALFCNNAGPAFIFGVVGNGLFGSLRLGVLLCGVHAASAVITGILLRAQEAAQHAAPAPDCAQQNAPPPPFSEAFVECVKSSGAAVLNVCMFVTVFSVLAGLLRFLTQDLLPDFAFALLAGGLELTSGVAALGDCAAPLSLKLAAASFLLAFSGLSVCAQTASILSPDGLFPRGYLFARLLQGLLSAALTLALCAALRVDQAALQTAAPARGALLPALGLVWLICGIICLICRKVSYGNRRAYRV